MSWVSIKLLPRTLLARLFELVGKLVKEWMAKLEERFWEHLDAEGTTPRGSKSQHVHLLEQAERLSPKLNSVVPTTDGSPR